MGTRTLTAVTGQMCTDDAWKVGAQAVVGQTELLRNIAAQIAHHGIAAAQDPEQRFLTACMPKVERDALLAPVQALEKHAAGALVPFVQPTGAYRAPDVPTLRTVLDLDDLSAHIHEELRPERAGAVLLDRQNSQVFQHRFSILIYYYDI